MVDAVGLCRPNRGGASAIAGNVPGAAAHGCTGDLSAGEWSVFMMSGSPYLAVASFRAARHGSVSSVTECLRGQHLLAEPVRDRRQADEPARQGENGDVPFGSILRMRLSGRAWPRPVWAGSRRACAEGMGRSCGQAPVSRCSAFDPSFLCARQQTGLGERPLQKSFSNVR